MWFSPSIRHVSRSKIHIYSCSQHILMTTITPTTSIKSSISFYSKSIKVFQNTDLRFNKFYILSSGKEIGYDVTFPGEGGLLHRSIRHVKSLKRTLYSLPKITLMYPYTPLHDVNVTSISATQELTILIFYIWANLRFDL